MDSFGDRLRTARLRRGLRQDELGRLCGLSQSAISSYERGGRRSTKKLAELAQVLGVDIYWLISGQGDMAASPGRIRGAAAELAWPFPSIEAGRFWALPTDARQTIEATVALLIERLQPSGR